MNIVDRMLGIENSIDVVVKHYNQSKKMNRSQDIIVKPFISQVDKKNITDIMEVQNMKTKRNLNVIIGGLLALSVGGGLVGCGNTNKDVDQITQPIVKEESIKKDIKPTEVKEGSVKKNNKPTEKKEESVKKDIKPTEKKEESVKKDIKPTENKKEDPKENLKYKKEYKEYLQYVRSTGGKAFPSYNEFLDIYNSYKKDDIVHPGYGNKKPHSEGSITDESIISNDNILNYLNKHYDKTFWQINHKDVYKNEGIVEVGAVGTNKEGANYSYEFILTIRDNRIIRSEEV